jgi:hypothetical protein
LGREIGPLKQNSGLFLWLLHGFFWEEIKLNIKK